MRIITKPEVRMIYYYSAMSEAKFLMNIKLKRKQILAII